MLQLLELVLRLVPLLARLARLGEGVEAAIKSSANKPCKKKRYPVGLMRILMAVPLSVRNLKP